MNFKHYLQQSSDDVLNTELNRLNEVIERHTKPIEEYDNFFKEFHKGKIENNPIVVESMLMTKVTARGTYYIKGISEEHFITVKEKLQSEDGIYVLTKEGARIAFTQKMELFVRDKRQIELTLRARKKGQLSYLRPDSKSQVSVRYENDKPICIETVVISTQHNPGISNKKMRAEITEQVINKVIPEKFRAKKMKIHINPTGNFVVGGPHGDCGLTGRKIIVDTYGGFSRHGGGAFSGKDPSKVDRSAAYMARYIAKNLVAAGTADRLEVQLAYAIGVADPVSVFVETFGTHKINPGSFEGLIRGNFNLKPAGIIKTLDLLKPRYLSTAAYGHFGRKEASFTWEKTDKVKAIKKSIGL